MKEMYLTELHREIMDILDHVIDVCEACNLKYYLIGGSLLGAVRHKGFIPWDDDLDIVMPRKDFEKFVKHDYLQLDNAYSLEWINTDSKYNKVFAKVTKKGTLFEEVAGENSSIKRGIFVDIFPIDITDGYSKQIERRKKKVTFWSGLLFAKSVSQEKSIIKRIILDIIPEKVFLRLAEHYMKIKPKKGGSYYSNFGSQYSIKRQTHLITNYGEGVLLQFEDRLYRCPTKYKDILESIYGSNYMELPPENKRRTHYPIRVILSNGHNYDFGRVKNRLSVGDD